jgi:hypothetical protein
MRDLGIQRRAGFPAFCRAALAVALCLLVAGVARAADSLPQPKGPVVLVITGDIARSNGPSRANFDLDMLKQIGMTSLVTSTPWTEGTSKFEGVLARDLLNYVGAQGDHITAISMNDYLVEIPIKDFRDHDVIFALKRDGKFLTVRDMGPVLIVYPFDRDTSLWTESVFTRCVLQLGAVYVGTPGSVPLASLLPGEQSPNFVSQSHTNDGGNGGTSPGGGPGPQANGPGTAIGDNGSGGNNPLNGGNSGLGVGGLGGGGTGNQSGTTAGGGKDPNGGGQSAVHSSQ